MGESRGSDFGKFLLHPSVFVLYLRHHGKAALAVPPEGGPKKAIQGMLDKLNAQQH